MEVYYIFHHDVVQELSSLCSPESLVQLSSSHRNFRLLIFELKYCDQRFYHPDINKFHNLRSIRIPRFYKFNNLDSNKLSRITSLIFYNYNQQESIILFTNLIDCRCKPINALHCRFYHSKLLQLNHMKVEYDEDILTIRNFTNVTSLNIVHCYQREMFDIELLAIYTNIKSLSITLINNICRLSLLIGLEKLKLSNFETFDGNKIFFLKNINLTYIDISSSKNDELEEYVFDNCTKLKYIKLSRCRNLMMNYVNNIRTLIIAESFSKFMNINSFGSDVDSKDIFDINKCENLEYLFFEAWNKSNRHLALTKLTKLKYVHLKNIGLNNDFSYPSIFTLKLQNPPGKENVNLTSFENLKSLHVHRVHVFNLTTLTKLEQLYLNKHSPNIFVDLNFHRDLTKLNLDEYNLTNLNCAIRLKYLSYNDLYSNLANEFDEICICKQLNHLSRLTNLKLYFEKINDSLFDCIWLSECVDLRSLNINMKLNNLWFLEKLNSLVLQKEYCNRYNYTINSLTRLTYISVYVEQNNIIADLRNLTRLEKMDANVKRKTNIRHPFD